MRLEYKPAVLGVIIGAGIAVIVITAVVSLMSSFALKEAEKPQAPRHREIPDGWTRHEVPGGWIYVREPSLACRSALSVFVARPAEKTLEKEAER